MLSASPFGVTPLRLWERFDRLDLNSDNEVRAFAAEWNFHHRVGGEWRPLVADGRINRAAVKELIDYRSIMGIATDAASRLTEAVRRGDKAGALREAMEIQVTTRVFFENKLAGPSLAISLETGLPRLQKSFLPHDLVGSGLLDRIRAATREMSKMSERQRQKIVEKVLANPGRALASESFKAFQADRFWQEVQDSGGSEEED